MAQNYAETLKQRRKAKGITIVGLSDKTGISQADLALAELGKKPLSAEQSKRIDKLNLFMII